MIEYKILSHPSPGINDSLFPCLGNAKILIGCSPVHRMPSGNPLGLQLKTYTDPIRNKQDFMDASLGGQLGYRFAHTSPRLISYHKPPHTVHSHATTCPATESTQHTCLTQQMCTLVCCCTSFHLMHSARSGSNTIQSQRIQNIFSISSLFYLPSFTLAISIDLVLAWLFVCL